MLSLVQEAVWKHNTAIFSEKLLWKLKRGCGVKLKVADKKAY